jgi:hypothetical protein
MHAEKGMEVLTARSTRDVLVARTGFAPRAGLSPIEA